MDDTGDQLETAIKQPQTAMENAGHQPHTVSKQPTLLTLPQELLDMIIEDVFTNTIINVNPNHRRTPASQNASLFLTCKTLAEQVAIPYYKHSIFQANTALDLESFLAHLVRNNIQERKYISQLHVSFDLDLLQDFDERTGKYFGAVFFAVREESRMMCLVTATQRLVDGLAERVRGGGYGIGEGVVVRGRAEFWRCRVWNVTSSRSGEGEGGGGVEDGEEE